MFKTTKQYIKSLYEYLSPPSKNNQIYQEDDYEYTQHHPHITFSYLPYQNPKLSPIKETKLIDDTLFDDTLFDEEDDELRPFLDIPKPSKPIPIPKQDRI